LEEAKLQRMPKPKPLSGRIALVTWQRRWHSGKRLRKNLQKKALCCINDINQERLDGAKQNLQKYSARCSSFSIIECYRCSTINSKCFESTLLGFGGADILLTMLDQYFKTNY
jgi:hypothetical protein